MEFSPQTNIVDLMEFQPGRITMAYAPFLSLNNTHLDAFYGHGCVFS